MKEIAPDYVYLDYAATAPLSAEAYDSMKKYLEFGRGGILTNANPNSLHTPGRNAFEDLESARRSVADSLHAHRPSEIIFTSSATESDNSAIIGIAHAAAEKRRLRKKLEGNPHIVTTSIEHDAVLSAIDALKGDGFDVTYITPNRDGFIEVRAFEDAISENTVLASIQMANSEIGSIQPISEITRIAHENDIYIHSDAVQALGKCPIDLSILDVDAMSFAGHKIGAPRGIGVLYLKNPTPFNAYLIGGGQEAGRRSGTQNTCGAHAFASACEYATSHIEDENARLRLLRDMLYRELSNFEQIQATVDVECGSSDYLPNIVNVIFDGIESQTLILRFDSLGFGISGGSACSSSSLSPSHVLTSMGISMDEALCACRISFGRYTTQDDIDRFLEAVPKVINW